MRIDSFRQDLRQALRLIARSPGFAATAALVMALGIGANTAIFSLLNGLLFRPPAVADPGSLVWLTLSSPTTGRSRNLSYPGYLEWRDGCRAFSGLVAYDRVRVALSGTGEPERIPGEIVSGNYFDVLGVTPAAGRLLAPGDDSPGAEPVAVISHALWSRRFGADPAVIAGLVLAVGLTRALSSLLFGVTPTDIVTLAAVAALLLAVAAVASWLPAQRAARVDPAAVLRADQEGS